MIKAAALVLAALLLPLAVVSAQQAADSQGLGRKIVAELHSIIQEHREAIREAVMEHKLTVKTLHEERLQIIRAFLNESKRLRDEVMAEMEALREQFKAGNITAEEYVSRLQVLTARLKALSKSSEKLGKLLSELAQKSHEAAKKMVEELRAANEDFGRRVSEEARTIGERAREEAGRGANATETHTESHGASQTAHGNRTEHGPPDGRGRTTTTTTTDSNPGNGRGRGRGG
jgi:chromosome segregation ATPase